MQLPVIPFRGPARPWTSIPRINWSHPLAQSLQFYAYDAGGYYIDLVAGSQGINNSPASVHPISIGSNFLGGGVKFNGGGVDDAGIYFPTTTTAKNFPNSPSGIFYSTFFGSLYTGTPQGGAAIASIADTGNNTTIAFYTNSSSTIQHFWANGASSNTFNQSIVTNTFQTWGFVATANGAATFYANGKLDQNATVTSSVFTPPSANPYGIGIDAGALNVTNFGGGVAGFIPFFAGWNRQLTAGDASTLHDDPYCFLIFPEDEMFATLVGSVPAAITALIAPLLGIPPHTRFTGSRGPFGRRQMVQPASISTSLVQALLASSLAAAFGKFGGFSGKTSLAANSVAEATGKAGIAGRAALTAASMAAAEGNAGISGKAALSAKSSAAALGKAGVLAIAGLISKSIAAAKGALGITAAAKLGAVSVAAAKGTFGPMSGKVSMAAKSIGAALGKLATSGSSGVIALFAASIAMARGKITFSGRTSLTGSSLSKGAGSAGIAGKTHLSANSAAQAKGGAHLGLTRFLTAASVAMAKGSAALSAKAVMAASSLAAGTGKLVIAGKAALSARGIAAAFGRAAIFVQLPFVNLAARSIAMGFGKLFMFRRSLDSAKVPGSGRSAKVPAGERSARAQGSERSAVVIGSERSANVLPE